MGIGAIGDNYGAGSRLAGRHLESSHENAIGIGTDFIHFLTIILDGYGAVSFKARPAKD